MGLKTFARCLPGVPVAVRRLHERREARPVSGISDGLRLTVPPKYAPRYFRNAYEPVTVHWLAEHLSRGMTAVDVGAHVGFLTCVMARAVGPSGHVVCFEPDRENAQYVQRNLAANALRADVHVAGAGAASGPREFHVTGSSDSHGFYDHPNTATVRIVMVDQVRLDDVLERADVLKIDTEGAECDVLEGAVDLLRHRPPMLVEWTPDCQQRAGRADDELVSRLDGLGYALQVLDDESGEVRDVEAVLQDLRGGRLRPGWYANVACEPAQVRFTATD